MGNHLKSCPYVSKKVKSTAKMLAGGKAKEDSDADDEAITDSTPFGVSPGKKSQQKLKVYRGVDIPFSQEQLVAVEEQTLKATLSANLPFRWIENDEVIKLFELFRSAADSKAHARKHRKNHSSDTVASLLQVPRYADILDLSGDTPEVIDDGSDSDTQRQNVFITTPGLWRKELAKWVEKERENESDTEEENQLISTRLRRSAATSLAKLFGGTTARPVTRPPRTTHSEEALLMELLEAEYEGEAPDDGALEGSGDDFDG